MSNTTILSKFLIGGKMNEHDKRVWESGRRSGEFIGRFIPEKTANSSRLAGIAQQLQIKNVRSIPASRMRTVILKQLKAKRK